MEAWKPSVYQTELTVPGPGGSTLKTVVHTYQARPDEPKEEFAARHAEDIRVRVARAKKDARLED